MFVHPTHRTKRDLDYILIVSTMQSRDTMSNFATEQRFPTDKDL